MMHWPMHLLLKLSMLRGSIRRCVCVCLCVSSSDQCVHRWSERARACAGMHELVIAGMPMHMVLLLLMAHLHPYRRTICIGGHAGRVSHSTAQHSTAQHSTAQQRTHVHASRRYWYMCPCRVCISCVHVQRTDLTHTCTQHNHRGSMASETKRARYRSQIHPINDTSISNSSNAQSSNNTCTRIIEHTTRVEGKRGSLSTYAYACCTRAHQIDNCKHMPSLHTHTCAVPTSTCITHS